MQEIFKFLDDYPALYAAMTAFLLFMIYRNMKQQVQKLRKVDHLEAFGAVNAPAPPTPQRTGRLQTDLLSLVLFFWSPRDPFTMRDLVRSVAIYGATGSGKTTGPGLAFAKALVGAKGKRHQFGEQMVGGPIGGLILASKPKEDRESWQKIFQIAGRLNDLIIFSPESQWRFNFIDYIQKCGGGTADITEAIMVIGETLEHGENQNRDQFWSEQNRRMIHCAVEVLRLAKGTVTAPDIQAFISSAAQTPAMLNTPEFKNSFHYKCLRAAHQKAQSSTEKHDFGMTFQYWKDEYPTMADKTRSSVVAGVMGILFVFNTGLVRELVSTTTNVDPSVMNVGMWILVDMPESSYGAAGRFILAGFKYLTQRHILHRKIKDDTAVTVIHCDEAQRVVNSHDAVFLAEARSHRGCMVYLTQSIHAYYTKLKVAGEHQADSFLTNFYTKIFCAVGDDKTAAYASSLIGRRLQTRVNTSMSPAKDTYDELFGDQRCSSSTSQTVENIVENREFMQNLRTGGVENGYMVDAVVVRSGQPFSNGEAYLKVSFSQR